MSDEVILGLRHTTIDVPPAVTTPLQGQGVHHEHHEQHFIWKYVFSQDHKIISKQYLITGMLWAIIGALFSVLFRLQLGFPNTSFSILHTLLGHFAPAGKLTPEGYYALVTMHGTILIFFVLTAG